MKKVSDSDKLNILADYFDKNSGKMVFIGTGTEVQDDLRRIARSIDRPNCDVCIGCAGSLSGSVKNGSKLCKELFVNKNKIAPLTLRKRANRQTTRKGMQKPVAQ